VAVERAALLPEPPSAATAFLFRAPGFNAALAAPHALADGGAVAYHVYMRRNRRCGRRWMASPSVEGLQQALRAGGWC
jgi:hypothetical protein